MFARTRRQIVTWYIVVIGAIFIAVGAAVLTILATVLDREVNDVLTGEADRVAAIIHPSAAGVARSSPVGGEATTGPRRTDDGEHEEGSSSAGFELEDAAHLGSGDTFSAALGSDGTILASSRDLSLTGIPYLPGMRRALAGEANFADIVAPDGSPVRLYSRAIRVGERDGSSSPTTPGLVVVQTGRSLASHRQELRAVLITLGIGTASGLLLALAGGLFLAERALRPIRRVFARQREFVADASHELRTPLAVIHADAEALERAIDAPVPSPEDPTVVLREQRGIVADIRTETEHLAHLVDDLLALASGDARRLVLDREVLDLGDLAAAVVAALQPRAAVQGLSLRFEVPGDTEPALVLGDAVRLRQLLLILLDNALKYTRTGGIAVMLRRIEGPPGDGRVEVTVRDTGIGIPPEQLPHIFERFYRVDKARSRAMGGAGLGLAIAREIARQHAGTLEAHSTPDVGSTFTLRLPALSLDTAHPDQD